MKIAFYIPVLNVGGAEKVIIDLLMQLTHSQHEFYLITDAVNSKWLKSISIKVQVININTKQNFFWRLYALINVIKKNKFDIVLSHLTHSNIHCLLIKLLYTYNLIIVEHSITSVYIKTLGGVNFYIKRLLIGVLFNFSNLIVAVSEATKKDLINTFRVRNGKCVVIYNPLDFDRIAQLSQDELNADCLTAVRHRKVIISVGRLEPIKNHFFLIESIKDFLIEHDAFLIIVGDGTEKEKLISKVHENNLENHVLFTGYEDNPYKYIKFAQVLVHPSKFEGFGLVLVEALYLATPVISMNFATAHEVLEDGKLGQIVKDKASMIDALDKVILSDSSLLAPPNFSKYVETKYSLTVAAEQYMNVFDVFNNKTSNV